jgi:hypothetical protein
MRSPPPASDSTGSLNQASKESAAKTGFGLGGMARSQTMAASTTRDRSGVAYLEARSAVAIQITAHRYLLDEPAGTVSLQIVPTMVCLPDFGMAWRAHQTIETSWLTDKGRTSATSIGPGSHRWAVRLKSLNGLNGRTYWATPQRALSRCRPGDKSREWIRLMFCLEAHTFTDTTGLDISTSVARTKTDVTVVQSVLRMILRRLSTSLYQGRHGGQTKYSQKRKDEKFRPAF